MIKLITENGKRIKEPVYYVATTEKYNAHMHTIVQTDADEFVEVIIDWIKED